MPAHASYNFASFVTEELEQRGVHVGDVSCSIADGDAYEAGFDETAETGFGGYLRLDVGGGADPANEGVVLDHGDGVGEEPVVLAVAAEDAVAAFEGLAEGDAFGPLLVDDIAIVGMDAADPEGFEVVVDEIGAGTSGEVEPAGVEEVDGAVGCGGAGQLGSAVEDEAGIECCDVHSRWPFAEFG